MKIQVGEIVINKTKKYLAPCINVYGARFGLEVNTITKVGLGIGDMITVKSGVRFEKHLFILVDVSSKLKQKTFNNTKQDVNKFFAQRPEVQKVLIKDNNYKVEFVKSLNKKFETTISPDEFDGELDFPLRKEEEEFNVHLLK